MNKYLKYILYAIAFILFVMIIFNPSPTAFKEYAVGLENPHYYIYRRQTNYIIFSVYVKIQKQEVDGRLIEGDENRYIGFLGNFFLSSEGIEEGADTR
jgi:hypothetical protein